MPDTSEPPAGRPLWQEKLRLLRKRWWRKTYAQHGEDAVLAALFEGVERGFYVDVGSFHPRRYSNTRLLYERGWRGINIDISARKVALFDFDRPGDRNIRCAVTDKAGELTAYVFGTGSALDTIDRATASAWAERFDLTFTEVQVPGRTLTDILDECAAPAVDYLNVDVEGAEMAVLAGLDLTRYAPRCLTIEIHGDLDTARRSPAYRLLAERGYELHTWMRPTFFFTFPA